MLLSGKLVLITFKLELFPAKLTLKRTIVLLETKNLKESVSQIKQQVGGNFPNYGQFKKYLSKIIKIK